MRATIRQPQARRIYILIDSSTKGTSESQYGPSTACWAVFPDRMQGKPLRVGLICCNYNEGPNKMFYIGIIRALEDCLFMGDENCIFELRGDCKPVINQLTGKWNVCALTVFYSQVKGIEKKFRDEHRGQIQYAYISGDNMLYKKVDRCAKEVRNFVEQRLDQR
jgi:ribonuclease HI